MTRTREEVVRELAKFACCDPDRDELGIRGAPCGTCIVCGGLRRAYESGRLAGATEERASVVEWLRAEGWPGSFELVERGAHLKGNSHG